MDEADRIAVAMVRKIAPLWLEYPVNSDEEALAIWNGLSLDEKAALIDAYNLIDWGNDASR